MHPVHFGGPEFCASSRLDHTVDLGNLNRNVANIHGKACAKSRKTSGAYICCWGDGYKLGALPPGAVLQVPCRHCQLLCNAIESHGSIYSRCGLILTGCSNPSLQRQVGSAILSFRVFFGKSRNWAFSEHVFLQKHMHTESDLLITCIYHFSAFNFVLLQANTF